MDTEKIVGEVAEVVRDLVARTITQAEERAGQIIDAAEAEAKTVMERAEREARELRQRAEHDAAVRMTAVRKAFEEMQSKIGIDAEVLPGPVTTPEPQPPSVPEPMPEPPSPGPDPTPEPEPPLIPEPTPPPDEGTPPEIAANGGDRSADSAGARLVAMNMALEGAKRDEIVALLSDDYELEDAARLVDEVLALAAK